MEAFGSKSKSELSRLGAELPEDATVRRFVADALERIDSLEAQLATSLQEVADGRREADLAAGRRARLDDLLLAQADEIEKLRTVLQRVQALESLARWSADNCGEDNGAAADITVLVDDLRRALINPA